MKEHHCVSRLGEHFVLYENNEGVHICPACGSAELNSPAYDSNGEPSFQMCSCGFEFGFDDEPSASPQAIESIVKSWERWRAKVIKRSSYLESTLTKCENNLKNLGISLRFDLIPTKDE
ncbi:MAG: hypothetical protein ACRBEE_14220 [Arenicella sp.]